MSRDNVSRDNAANRRGGGAVNIAQERMLDLLQAVSQEHDGLPASLRPPLNALGEAIETNASTLRAPTSIRNRGTCRIEFPCAPGCEVERD